MQFLRQSTASQSVLLGPFVDSTDGVTAETGLTIANTDIRLSANGGNMAAKNSGGGTHDEAGWYTATFDATDTATVGRLQVSIAVSGALPVFMEFQVLEEAVYDAFFAASATNRVAGIDGTIQTLDALDTAQDTQHNTTQSAVSGLNDLSTADVDARLAAIGLDHLLSSSLPTAWGTDVAAGSVFDELAGSTFSSSTDSLESIRDRGDAAWTTGAGGSDRLLMVDTTIATLASQTSFTLTAGSADDDAYNGCTIVIEDASTSTQKATGIVSDYTGSTKTVTLLYNPGIFTMAASDKVYILAERGLKTNSASNFWVNVTNAGLVDSNPKRWDDTLIASTSPFDAVATAAALATVDGNVDSILTDTGTTLPAQISGLNNLSTADIDARLAAFGWTSITISAVSGAVGSVTGNVGGNVVGSVASVTGNVGGNVAGSVASVTGTVGGIAGTIQTLDALDTAQDTQHSTTQSAISGLNDLDAAGVRTAVGLASANLDTQLGYITDYSAYSLTVLAGAISNADNAAESYTKTLNSVAYTVTYAGLDTDGNRTSSTLSKV